MKEKLERTWNVLVIPKQKREEKEITNILSSSIDYK
jgi:hypothetical protein